MKPKQIIEKLEQDSEFKAWKKENPDSYLAHIFKMYDEANKGIVQVGYYNKDDSITTFFIEKEDIKIATDKEIFKKPDSKIAKLEIGEVKLDDAEAKAIAEKLLKEEYKMEAIKSFLILQNVEKHGLIYNVTFVTKAFSTLNVKVDASTGKVLKHELNSLMDYKQG